MKTLHGISASAGAAMGDAFLYADNEASEIPRFSIAEEQIGAELDRLALAVQAAAAEVAALHKRAAAEMGKEQAAIIEAHLMMLEDPDFIGQITARLKKHKHNAEWALTDTAQELTQKMLASADEMFRERAADINDVSRRVLSHLLPVKKPRLDELDRDVILAAADLLPSEVLTMNRGRVKGIVTDMGSRTSHTAILARAFNIPAVLGLRDATKKIKNGDTVVVDAAAGKVFVNPDKKAIAAYERSTAEDQKLLAQYLSMRDLPAETTDGRRVTLKANIEIPEEAAQAVTFGAEGIGLYRSEFLFLAPGRAPGEDEQYKAYRRVLDAMKKKPVTIRTVDIGGDKILKDFPVNGAEKNPLLGWRAIRFSLSRPDLFKTQLRAILRAAVHGNVKIMFPLVSGLEELEQALALLEEAKAECAAAGNKFADGIETGVMIEVPSAAVIADILAQKAAFFSVGTNDLTQYSLAVDRGNERVSYLAQPLHPALIRLLDGIITAAHNAGIKAAMCGEMAGDPALTPVLLGLGLDEFSMSASSIPQVKRIVRGVKLQDCRALAEDLLPGKTGAQNAALLKRWTKEYVSGA